jgi:ATP-dependent 26S proteasome regulatory subunit
MFLRKHGLQVEDKPEFQVGNLTKREQEVFLVLYTLDGTKSDVTYDDVGGSKKALEQLREVVEIPLLHPERFILFNNIEIKNYYFIFYNNILKLFHMVN